MPFGPPLSLLIGGEFGNSRSQERARRGWLDAGMLPPVVGRPRLMVADVLVGPLRSADCTKPNRHCRGKKRRWAELKS